MRHADRLHTYMVCIASLMLCYISVCQVRAQDDVEYRYEIGAGLGATTYYGDFNSRLFGNLSAAGAAVFKMVVNPHSAVSVTGMYSKIKGEYDKAQTYCHPFYDEGYKYNSSIVDLSVRYEYNFWPYGTGKDYRGAVRWAPFVALGIGLTGVKCQERTVDYATSERMTSSESLVTANIPLGIGVKYRYGDRMNFALQWMMHFSLSDQLDGVKDPSYVKSNGLFKNTDCYSVLMFTLTYSFSAKCPTCMKDR